MNVYVYPGLLVLPVDPQITLDDYVEYDFVLVWFLQQEEVKILSLQIDNVYQRPEDYVNASSPAFSFCAIINYL